MPSGTDSDPEKSGAREGDDDASSLFSASSLLGASIGACEDDMEEIGASENDQPERRPPRRTRSLKDVISNISSWKERRSLQRAEARQAADGRRAAAQREALGRVWDRGQLKAGHLVDDADVAASQHPNTWTPHGVIKTAFEATSARHGHSTRNTCHVLDTL